jgi:hypothetical protein
MRRMDAPKSLTPVTGSGHGVGTGGAKRLAPQDAPRRQQPAAQHAMAQHRIVRVVKRHIGGLSGERKRW